MRPAPHDLPRDIVVIGGGLIGLAMARELRARSLTVALLERGLLAREASWAGAGMLAALQTPADSPLRDLCLASARLYPDFVREIEAETGEHVDFRAIETKVLDSQHGAEMSLPDRCIDNRLLAAALATAARQRGVEIVEHCEVHGVLPSDGSFEIQTSRGRWIARRVVNAAGAWAGSIGPPCFRAVRPRKGQMLALQADPNLLPHILVGGYVYLVPRSDGRILVGATVEDVGFNKDVEPRAIGELHRAAATLIPALATLPIAEQWAGLRPGSADDLPLIGETEWPGCWAATGHFRDGILLTPITARLIADWLTGRRPEFDLRPFDPGRFALTRDDRRRATDFSPR